MKKRFMSGVLALCIVISLFPTVVMADNSTSLLAVPSKTSFAMNGKPVSVTQAYSINGTNYLQLRAIAELLKGTAAQFNVGWDGKYAVIETGKPYDGTATPTALKNTNNVKKSNTSFKLDGTVITFDNTYLIDGNTNYLQLREFAQKLSGTKSQFNVYWDSTSNQAVIVPGYKYTGAEPDLLSDEYWDSWFSDLENSFNDLMNELTSDIDLDFDLDLDLDLDDIDLDTDTDLAATPETAKPTPTAPPNPVEAPKTPATPATAKPSETPKPTTPALPTKVYTDRNVSSLERNNFKLFDEDGNSITRHATGAEVVITKNIKTIEKYAFYGNNAGKFTVESGNPSYTAVDGVLFNKDKTVLIAYPLAKADKSYKVPDSVTEIGQASFAYSTNLKEIEIGSKVKTIGVDAFRGANLEEIVLPDGVATINGCAFNDMKELKKLYIPTSVKMIVDNPLKGSNPNAVIYGKPGSMAEYIANTYGYKFESTTTAGSGSGSSTSGLTTIKLGQTEAEAGLGKNLLAEYNTSGGRWGVYGNSNYKNFLAVYYENDKAKYLYTTDLSTYNGGGATYTDKNNNNKEYAASIGVTPSSDEETNEKLIFHITNAFRALHGLSPLKWNDKLQAAARSHSEDMEIRDFFDHTNPDGLEPWDRVTAAGYKWRACAENIYMYSLGADAIHAMDGWINSPGHRVNLLTKDCDELGVGISGAYATQNFGSR